MANNEQKFIYTLEAQYKGSGELGRLKDDLKSLKQVESMKQLGADVLELNRRFREARTELENQARQMKAADTVTREMTANYRKAQTEVGRLAEQLDRKQQAYRQSREVVRAAGIDTAKLAIEEKRLADAARATGEVWSARQALGVRAHRDVRDEILRLRTAYDTLRASGTLTTSELIQAKQQLNARIAELRANTTSWATSLSRVQAGLLGMAGAYLGFQSIAGMAGMMKEAETSAYALEASLMAANREFGNIGDASSWGDVIGRLSEKLKIYSKSDLTAAAAATIDMTKRLGLSREQMEELIERTADLSAGKTDLKGGIDRVTAALRGEAEASEYLGLTLNETYVKAWHEAHNASGQAWKDLTDLEKAQVRYNVFLEQASPLAGKAANSVKTMSGAYALAKAEIHDAVSENENATEAMTALATAIADNADEIGALAAMIITAAAEVMKFVLAHKEAVITVGMLTAGAGALALGISSLSTIWGGLNGVMLLTTGSQVLPWLGSIITSLKGVQLAALGATGALGAAAGATLALMGGYSLGKKIAEWEYFRDVVGANKAALAEVPAKFAAITQATGVTIKSFEDLDRAQKDGLIRFNQATGAWEKVTAAARESAQQQKQVTGEALKEMERQYKEFVDEVKRLQGEIAGRQQSLVEDLRAMGRTGMSGLEAWQDLKREAEEYEQAARAAAEAGDLEQAVKMADAARDRYKQLNTEVKDGDRILVSQQDALQTAMEGVKRAGELAIEILGKQEQAAAEAAKKLDLDANGQLSKAVEDVADGIKDVADAGIDMGDTLVDQINRFGTEAAREFDDIERWLNSPHKMTIDIEKSESHSLGGMIGMASGGYLAMRNLLRGGYFPGFGGGDRRHVVAEDGEYMFDKYRVRDAGLGIVRAFHAGRYADVVAGLMQRFNLNIGDIIHRKIGGAISRLDEARAAGPQYLAAGGPVVGGGDGEVVTFRVEFGRGRSFGPFTGPADDATAMLRTFQHALEASS